MSELPMRGHFRYLRFKTFQRHQEHPNARCFSPCCRALNIRESRRTPTPQLFQVLGFTPTLGQVRVATTTHAQRGGYLFLPGFSSLYDAIHGWMTGQMDGWMESFTKNDHDMLYYM
jgi:hypothetical protein